MPEYLSPGVYVEEVDAGPKPIEGVSTSTAGAVGVTAMGPSDGRPVLVTSFAEFQRTFGGLLPEPRDPSVIQRWEDMEAGGHFWRFPLAVKGFFDNGGQRLYVKRVVASGPPPADPSVKEGAQASSAVLKQGLYLDLRTASKKGDQDIELARVSQLTGISTGAKVLLVRTDGAGAPQGPFTVESHDAAAATVKLDKGLDGDVAPGGWVLAVQEPPGAPNGTNVFIDKPSLTFRAFAVGDWGNALAVRVRASVATSLALLPFPGGAGAPAANTELVDAVAKDATQLKLKVPAGFANNDKVLIQGRAYKLSNAAGDTFTITPAARDALAAGTAVRRLRMAVDPAAPKVLNVANASRLYEGALLEVDDGKDRHVVQVESRVGSQVTVEPALPAGTLTDVDVARLIEARVEVSYQPDPDQPATTELFDNLRLKNDGSPSHLVTRINQDSRLVRVAADKDWEAAQPSLGTFPAALNGAWAPLGEGDDRLDQLVPDDFVGRDLGPGQRSGIAALEDIDEISLCMAPGIWARDVRGALITHCESLKDRFAIVDPPPAKLLDVKVRVDPETLKGPVDTKYGALYYPWLMGRDFAARRDVLLPPSGHVAGIYARTDVERGVHKAPANEVVRGISGFEIDITKREQDLLNPRGVNALRSFPGRGLRVWGARTLSSDGAWKYVNVRRLFIFVEESIDEGTQWVVFEPNDEKLWARVRATITQFLDRLWREGMLQGETRNEAYFVKCDRTTMTQDDIDNGRLLCLVGIAPVKPAEFVIFRIQQKTLDQKS
ncbi:phage tail sheath family protein [Pyxidicoccus xibeiensis]|uniref:phage tail sheath family protein n=1 Tax=Pyxidicoccus xibeiensis TaxID=2906759 RepID=UPI0020A79ACA|nr:phage tail sheath C-terminal domain-containing protein [Pyxidicoccus xibeiensis]MCP3143399.1 phage tail sheath subtilisin-like domain-containing protein [Pyxidicoccus xibeiensis]